VFRSFHVGLKESSAPYNALDSFLCLDEIPVQSSKVAHLEGENFGDAYKSILEDYFGKVYLP